MADMNYTNSPSGYNLETSSAGFQAPGMGDLEGLFRKMAAKKAEDAMMAQRQARLNQEAMQNQMNEMRPDPIRETPEMMEVPQMGLLAYQGGQPGMSQYVNANSLAARRGYAS